MNHIPTLPFLRTPLNLLPKNDYLPYLFLDHLTNVSQAKVLWLYSFYDLPSLSYQ
ncbi:hypothetical protein PAXRUDRAFT_21821 [Paxillus rubicundulus Ve08.2h10]|uniref:Unplaced genomic scaffold scaffold_5847, whole genome shotgun sequence n=1 Tax=Paxillus rubicundulus Ve08.2h10 TaxID=930991 RepID=A0A0D0BLP0_9AGAM|nr:hypothetical protein PAXRUDRAFT_21821 [Paxillus rubicundulus Ve08.2h10]